MGSEFCPLFYHYTADYSSNLRREKESTVNCFQIFTCDCPFFYRQLPTADGVPILFNNDIEQLVYRRKGVRIEFIIFSNAK